MPSRKYMMRNEKRLKPQKTVFIFGAGFSIPAGGPTQISLVRDVFSLEDATERIVHAKKALREFLVDVMSVAPNSVHEISLEDIYTPIDRCLADRVSLRDKTAAELHTVRGHLEQLISVAIQHRFEATPDSKKKYVRDFARYLVRAAARRADLARKNLDADDAKAYDPVAVISLNWDIILDRCLYQALGEHDHWRTGDYEAIGVVDYCCYISSIDKHEKRIRSGLWALGSKGYNVKLLKIHGSMNWLQCLNCQRLFVGFDEKINIPNYINALTCRHCRKFGINALLQGSLIMPTFLKDLSNFQIKLVWQDVGVELMEASELVFIGYSLPHADFEFRQLLSRMVQKDAKVHVVLYEPKGREGKRRYNEDCNHYRQFFGARRITFESGGVTAFVNSLPTTSRR
jgi:hypothetical protein